MIAILFQLLCFFVLASMVMCVIPEPDKQYTPRERPPFNQKIWEPTQEQFEQYEMKYRWTTTATKPSAPDQIPTIHAV